MQKYKQYCPVARASEVLADDTARHVKAGFGATPALYLGAAG